MIPEPLVLLTDASDHELSLVKTSILPNRSEWVNDNQAVSGPVLIDNYTTARLQHMVSGKIKSDPTFQVDRHNFTIFISVPNSSAEGRVDVGSVGITVAVPNSGVVTQGMINEALYAISEFSQDSATIARFLRKES